MWPVYLFIGLKPGGVDTAVGVLKRALEIAYMFSAVRAVYGLRGWRSAAAALLLTAGHFLTYMVVFVGAFVAALLVVALP